MIIQIKRLLQKEKYTLEGAKKKMKEFRIGTPKQLNFPFIDEKYRVILKDIKKELNLIKDILS